MSNFVADRKPQLGNDNCRYKTSVIVTTYIDKLSIFANLIIVAPRIIPLHWLRDKNDRCCSKTGTPIGPTIKAKITAAAYQAKISFAILPLPWGQILFVSTSVPIYSPKPIPTVIASNISRLLPPLVAVPCLKPGIPVATT